MATPIRPNTAVSVTDKQGKAQKEWLDYWADIATSVGTAANPTATIGLTAVNGSASTFMRSDAAPALGSSVYGNPSGTIGLTANNGVATTLMRTDSRHALSQAIIPVWTGEHGFSAGIRIKGALSGGSLITTDTLSPTHGINFTNLTIAATNFAFATTASRIWGNGDADFGYGLPLISSDIGRVATLHAQRNVSGSHPALGAGEVRSAIRGITHVANGAQSIEWAILGILNDDGGIASGNCAIYGQVNKTRDRANMADWGGCFEMHGRSLSSDPVGSEIGVEISMSGTGTDANGVRTGLLISCFTDQNIPPVYQVQNGILFQAEVAASAVLKTGIQFASSLSSVGTCMDTTFISSLTGYVLNMLAGHKLSFSSGTKNLYYSTANTALRYDAASYSYLFRDNGVADAFTWTSTSDRRAKVDERPVEDGMALALALKPKRYKHRMGDGELKPMIGFVADDVLDVLPELVNGTPDDEQMMSMSYDHLAAVSIAAIQELNARVAALEAR